MSHRARKSAHLTLIVRKFLEIVTLWLSLELCISPTVTDQKCLQKTTRHKLKLILVMVNSRSFGYRIKRMKKLRRIWRKLRVWLRIGWWWVRFKIKKLRFSYFKRWGAWVWGTYRMRPWLPDMPRFQPCPVHHCDSKVTGKVPSGAWYWCPQCRDGFFVRHPKGQVLHNE